MAVLGYTFGMKVAVSIPDEVFADAEQIVRQMQTSRSDVYARALVAFVRLHDTDTVTSTLNAVVDSVDEVNDVLIKISADQLLKHSEW